MMDLDHAAAPAKFADQSDAILRFLHVGTSPEMERCSFSYPHNIPEV